MINPIYHEYRRSSLMGAMLVLILSLLGGAVHYIRSVDSTVLSSKDKLAVIGMQLDTEFRPILTFAEAVRRTAEAKLDLPPLTTDSTITVLKLASGSVTDLPVNEQQSELQMLLRLWPYFELAPQAQPHLVAMYYVSEQGFVVNGQNRWPDYVADQFILWQQQHIATPAYQRDMLYYTEFLPQQAALALPLYANDVKLGRFVFAVSLQTVLAPLQNNNTGSRFMLLDTTGELIHSSTALSATEVDGHMLQVQRLSSMPWSVALLEQKTSLFAAGVKEFVWHWLSYLLLLTALLLVMQYRYRRRTLSAINRLLVHIERLVKGQTRGVRHVPQGWHEVFDRVCQLTQRSGSSE